MANRELTCSLCVIALVLAVGGALADEAGTNDMTTVLVAGDPPLTVATVHDFAATLEWALDAKFTEDQFGILKAGMVDSWERKVKDDMDTAAQLIAFYTQATKLSEAEQAVLRQALQGALLDGARQQTEDETSKWLLGVYDAAHEPIAQGPPALTRQMTDAYSELLVFMLAQAASRPELTPNDEFRDGFAQEIAAGWAGMGAEERTQVAEMPGTWGALRLVWERATEEQREALRDQWRESLKPVIDKLPAPPAPETQPAATTAAAPGESLPLKDATAAGYEERGRAYKEAARNEDAVADLLQAIKLEPKRTSAVVALGDAYRGMGDRDKAIDQYLRAVSLDAKSRDAYNGLYLAYRGTDDTAQARKYWNEKRKLEGKPYADTDWNLAQMAALQAQQQNFQMMSNMLRMQHETNMTIINNIGGWSTTWRNY